MVKPILDVATAIQELVTTAPETAATPATIKYLVLIIFSNSKFEPKLRLLDKTMCRLLYQKILKL